MKDFYSRLEHSVCFAAIFVIIQIQTLPIFFLRLRKRILKKRIFLKIPLLNELRRYLLTLVQGQSTQCFNIEKKKGKKEKIDMVLIKMK